MVDGWMDYDCRCFQLSCGHSVNEDDHFYPLSVFVIESTDQVISASSVGLCFSFLFACFAE